MFNKYLDWIADIWIANKIIDADDKDIYIYGLDLLISTVINIFCILLTAAIMDKLMETVALLVIMVPMQAFGGGYHAKTHLRCFLIMYIGWWIVLPLLNSNSGLLSAILILFATPTVWLFAPVPNVNAPMSEPFHRKMKKRVRILLIVDIFIIFSIFVGISSYYGFMLSLGLGLTAFSMLVAKIVYVSKSVEMSSHTVSGQELSEEK